MPQSTVISRRALLTKLFGQLQTVLSRVRNRGFTPRYPREGDAVETDMTPRSKGQLVTALQVPRQGRVGPGDTGGPTRTHI
jgi:hypothetical protein